VVNLSDSSVSTTARPSTRRRCASGPGQGKNDGIKVLATASSPRSSPSTRPSSPRRREANRSGRGLLQEIA